MNVTLTGDVTASRIHCESGFLTFDTSQGKYVAGVPSAGDWDCNKALSQWRTVNPTDGQIGLRYKGGGSDQTLLMMSDRGSSMTLKVTGFCEVS